MRKKSESGSIIVEASIYFPLVIGTVMAMIYLGLLNMQESIILYQVDRIAAQAAREEAYPGYEVFGMNQGRSVDFAWGADMPSVSHVEGYYKARHETLADLYRGIVSGISSLFTGNEASESEYEAQYANMAREITLISAGVIGVPDVEIEKGFFSSSVTVTITHEIPVPGIVRYLGYEGEWKMQCRTSKNIINPSEFVRNVDLAVDLVEFLCEKLGIEDQVSGFIQKAKEIMQTIL